MSPETLIIDMQCKGVGRIHRASGTTNPAVVRKIKRALRELKEDGRFDILRAVRDGHVTLMQVYDAHRRRALHELPIGEAMPLVATAMERWIDDAERAEEYSAKHINGLRRALRHVKAADPHARIADLPRVLEALRSSLGVKHARAFNLVREAASAFVRATLKRNHPIWLAVRAVEPRVAKRKARPAASVLSPGEFRERFPHPESNKVDAIAWAMATHGMGSKEYWGRWQTKRDRVHIAGTKRLGRVRDVPLVLAPVVPPLSRDRFEKLFRKRFHGAITPYDLRRTYSRWMELAQIPRTRRRLYMGHGAKDVTDLYEEHEITAFLVEDAKKLRAFLALPEPKTGGLTIHA